MDYFCIFPEDGSDDAEICRSDIRLYWYISKLHLFGVMDELFNSMKMHGIRSVKLSDLFGVKSITTSLQT